MSQPTGVLTEIDIKTLERAFPSRNDAGDLTYLCAWDGKSRRQRDALCRSCWASLSDRDRIDYIGRALVARAYWIVERIKPRTPR